MVSIALQFRFSTSNPFNHLIGSYDCNFVPARFTPRRFTHVERAEMSVMLVYEKFRYNKLWHSGILSIPASVTLLQRARLSRRWGAPE